MSGIDLITPLQVNCGRNDSSVQLVGGEIPIDGRPLHSWEPAPAAT
jgi:hypothetical protein